MTKRGRPKTYIPPDNPFPTLRKAGVMGCEIKPFRVGKEVLSGEHLRNAIHRGEKVKLKGRWVDPKILDIQLKLRKGTDLHMGDSTIGRLRARGFINDSQMYAGQWFRDLYRRAYGLPEARIVNLEGVSGGRREDRSPKRRKAVRKYMKFVNKIKKNEGYYKLGTLITFAACDNDPPWLDLKKIPTPDKFGIKTDLFIPESRNYQADLESIVNALNAVIDLMGWRRAA